MLGMARQAHEFYELLQDLEYIVSMTPARSVVCPRDLEKAGT